jgi:hydroxymethylbilane synthase
MPELIMATRGSALALAQSGQIARELESRRPGLTVRTLVVKTSGDLFGAPSPEKARELPQGAKGLWVKEIEAALLDGRADFAVHSGKDLPAELARGLTIAAYPTREDPRDVLVARGGLRWGALGAGHRVATSSLRRRLMITALKPGVIVEPLRGNVDTRLRKLAEGEFDAMVIAAAGLNRLGRADVVRQAIDPTELLPAPAQGALALEARKDRSDVREILSAVDDAPTRLCVEFERAFLAAVGGGCGSPVGAYAVAENGGVRLEAYYAAEGSAGGKRVGGVCADPASRDAFIRHLAETVAAR